MVFINCKGGVEISKNQITKKALAESLKKLSQKWTLNNITIKDITDECGVNRQTFYYHFQDKYELINWIYYTEAVESISDYRDFDHWSLAINEIFSYLAENKLFYRKALKIEGRNSFNNYFFEITREIIKKVVDEVAEEMAVSEKDKNFIADFYTHALVGLTVQWIKGDLKETPDSLTRRIRDMVDGSMLNALARYEEGNK